MQRRDFLKKTAEIAAACSFLPKAPFLLGNTQPPDLVVTKDGSPSLLVRRALEELGGISRFIKRGDIVVIKPNMSWDRLPEQAATTNPEVVQEVVRLCIAAGAKKVKIFDNTLNEARRCYARSGIEKAAKDAGAEVFFVYDGNFKKVSFPEGELVKSWELYKDALEADKIINLPVAKHHSISGVSLGMKNFMGFLGGNRGQFHRQFDVKVTDLNTKVRANLIILDAYRVLLRNGPSGGNLADVELKKMVVAGTDPVAVDSFGATLFNLDPQRIGFLQIAQKRGLGETNLQKLTIRKLSLTS